MADNDRPTPVAVLHRYDDPIAGHPKFYAEHVGPVVDWHLDLLKQADGTVLIWQDGKITLNCENGSWTWVETGRTDHGAGGVVVHARWPD